MRSHSETMVFYYKQNTFIAINITRLRLVIAPTVPCKRNMDVTVVNTPV